MNRRKFGKSFVASAGALGMWQATAGAVENPQQPSVNQSKIALSTSSSADAVCVNDFKELARVKLPKTNVRLHHIRLG